MNTAVRYFAHIQNKLQEVLEHELPNIEKAVDFVVDKLVKEGIEPPILRVLMWMVEMNTTMRCLRSTMVIGSK